MASPVSSPPSCPICESPSRLWHVVRREDRDWSIFECTRCRHGWVHPRPTLEFLMEYYATSGHGDRSGGQTLDRVLREEEASPNSTVDARRIVERLVGFMPSSATPRRLLDVGCGYGFYTREAQRQGFEVRALELASIERAIAAEMTGVTPDAVSFEDFAAPGGSFSSILMSQILEHALDVHAWIAKSCRLLAPSGILMIALPNFAGLYRRLLGARDPFVIPPAHLNYFTPKSLDLLLRRHGFRVERMETPSHLPRAIFDRRFGKAGPAIGLASRVPLSLADALGMGIMINAYARRVDC